MHVIHLNDDVRFGSGGCSRIDTIDVGKGQAMDRDRLFLQLPIIGALRPMAGDCK